MIDTFSIIDEKFVNNKYIANFEVKFNKKEVLNFLYKNNIFASIPQSKKLFLLPILVDTNQSEITLLSENPFYIYLEPILQKYHLIKYVFQMRI